MSDRTRTRAARERASERRTTRARKAWERERGQAALDQLILAHTLGYHAW